MRRWYHEGFSAELSGRADPEPPVHAGCSLQGRRRAALRDPRRRLRPETTRAVSAFQRQNGLPENGETDNRTWNLIVDTFTRLSPLVLPAASLSIVWQPLQTISYGEENLQLPLIQGMLVAIRGIFPDMPELRVTGIHDAASVRAVRWFQQKSGLKPDGVLTQIDWLYLTGLYRLVIGDGTQSV